MALGVSVHHGTVKLRPSWVMSTCRGGRSIDIGSFNYGSFNTSNKRNSRSYQLCYQFALTIISNGLCQYWHSDDNKTAAEIQLSKVTSRRRGFARNVDVLLVYFNQVVYISRNPQLSHWPLYISMNMNLHTCQVRKTGMRDTHPHSLEHSCHIWSQKRE